MHRLRLKAALISLGKSQTDLAREIMASVAQINLLANRGIWPRSIPRNDYRARIVKAMRRWTDDDEVIRSLFDEWPDERGNARQADPALTADQKEEQMLLRNESLTQTARDHFGLVRNPFIDDVSALADVFVSAATRRARAALMDCALNQGFVALVGESGSGKTTLREELEERIRLEDTPVVVIKPFVMEMERAVSAGRPMWAGQISEAIVAELAPGVAVRRTAQARLKQVYDVLSGSAQAGYSNLLVIEEAHRLPIPTLRALKGYMELKVGLRRLLGVVLIGQPELDDLLSDKRADLREIVQRCERREMLPLDDDLTTYLTHKLERVGARLADVMDDSAPDAIRARLIRRPRGGSLAEAQSICYPLVVNNLVARALNAAAAVKMPRVTADVIMGC